MALKRFSGVLSAVSVLTFAASLLAAAALGGQTTVEYGAALPPAPTEGPLKYIVVCTDTIDGHDNPEPAAQSRTLLERGDVLPDAGDVVVAVAGRYWRRVGDDQYRDETCWVEDRYLLPLADYDTLRAADEKMRANDAGAAEALRAAAAKLTEREAEVSFSPDGRRAALLLWCAHADAHGYDLNAVRRRPGRVLHFEAGRGLTDISYYDIYPVEEQWSPDGRRWALLGQVEFVGNAYRDGLNVYDAVAGEWKWLGPCTWAEDYELEFVGPYVVWLGAEEKTMDIGESYPTEILMPAVFAYRFDTGETITLLAADPATLARESSGNSPCAGDIYFPVTLKAVGEPPPELGASPIYQKLNGAVAHAIVNVA